MEICVSGDVPGNKICTKFPRAVRSTATFVIDLEKVDHQEISADDNGIYGKHSCPSERVKLKLTDKGKIDSVATLTRGQANSKQDEDESELFIVRRQYNWHKSTDDFCRIVSKVEHDCSSVMPLCNTKWGTNVAILAFYCMEMTEEKTRKLNCKQNLLSWKR